MNFNKLLILYVFFQSIILFINCTETQYDYLSYDQIISLFEKLEQKYPNLIKVGELRNESQIQDLPETKCGQKICKHIYAEITNFQKSNYKQNPQALIIGGFHGDEAIGPNVVAYLAEYILNNYENSEYFKDMVNNKMIVLLPMANPSGYYRLQREEQQINGNTVDINRDFPYNNEPEKCFQSAGARVINYLFKKYLFQTGITFHGGMYAIGYPWGSVNHEKYKHIYSNNGELSPDNTAFDIIGNYMKDMSPGNKNLNIDEYPVDTLTNGIYSVPGTLEDWAYAAQWEPELTKDDGLVVECKNVPKDEQKLPENSVKSLFYLIETSEPKKPSANKLGTYEAVQDKNSKNFGHIPRNIKASLAIIETLKPTIFMSVQNINDNLFKVSWKVYGCSQVDKTYIYHQFNDYDQNEQIKDYGFEQIQQNFIQSKEVYQGEGYIKNQEYEFTEIINGNNLRGRQQLNVAILAECDSQFLQTSKPVPNFPPQSHLVQARTNNTYNIQNENGYEILQTQQVIYTNFNEISQINEQKDSSEQSILILIFVACIVIILIVIAYYVVKRIIAKYDPQHQFFQMDKKLTGEDKIKRKLQIDMGVSQTDFNNSGGGEEIQFDEEEGQKKTLHNMSTSKIKHVIE